MRWLAAALLAVALPAGAWCTMPPPANPGPVQPQLPNVPHKCWPAKWGLSFLTGKGYVEADIAAVQGATTEGGHCAAWWCQDAAGAWNVESHCALASYTVGGIAAGITAALGAPDPVTALQTFADRYTVTLTDPGQINSYNCLHWSIQQQALATKPITNVQTWRVPAGGSAVYPVVNGKLGVPIPNRRAAGNALCDLVKLKVVSGAYTYGAFDGSAATEVALCTKVN